MKNKLHIILICTFLCLAQNVGAQAPEWLWAKSAGGASADKGNGIATDADGNVLVTGYFRSSTITFGATTLTNTNTGDDIFVVKYDALGNVLWAKSAVGTSNDFGQKISTDSNGNVIITGYFFSPTLTFGAITLTNSGVEDIFIVKYDSSGNLLWAKSVGGTNEDRGESISIDESGNIFITGYFESASINFGTTTLTNANNGIADVFIVKLDASGNELWAKSAGALAPDYGKGISTDASGNVFLTGYFGSPSITFESTTLTRIGNIDIFVVKYDTLGNFLWAKSAGGLGFNYAMDICTDANGNALVTGSFGSPTLTFDSITITNAVSFNMFVVKYDASGNAIWAKSEGSNDDDWSQGISSDTSGNILITGYFSGASTILGDTTLTNVGGNDIFITKYDTSGLFLWAKSVGGINDDIGQSVSADPNGNVVMTGNFISTSLSFGTTTLTNTGVSDIFVAKLDASVLGFEDIIISNKTYFYPNPSKDIITFQNISEKSILEIFDVTGKKLLQLDVDGNNNSININSLSEGIYFLKVNNQFAGKLVKK